MGLASRTSNNMGGATGITVQNCEIYDISGSGADNVAGILPWLSPE